MSYSPLLGLLQPSQGSLTGTWGTDINNYLTQYLDTAVAGTLTLSADSDVTLTTSTGTALGSTSAQYAVINCTGARTALRTITVPAQSKVYAIINGTSGGYGVKIVGSGPTTGVTVVAGSTAFVAWNGSDFVFLGLVTNSDIVASSLTVKSNTLQALTFSSPSYGSTGSIVSYDSPRQLLVQSIGSGAFLEWRVGEIGFQKSAYMYESGGINVGTASDPGTNALATAGKLSSYSSSAGIGYSTGAGGTVTQTPSRINNVTIDRPTGAITLASGAGSSIWSTFIVYNSTVTATDVIVISQKSGANVYLTSVSGISAGQFNFNFATTGGTSTDSPTFNFAIIRTATS
jgi:hypothetical protein